MVATTGMTFISAIRATRIMAFQLVLRASPMGERRATVAVSVLASSLTKAGVSWTSRRMMKPASRTKALSRKGMRQPQLLKASAGMK